MAFCAFTASFISLSLWASVAALWAARAALFASTSSSKALASRPVAALFFACCSFHLAFLSISSSSFLRERSSASFALAASVTASNATWVFGAVVVSLSDSAEFICAISSSLAILEARRTCVAGTGREGGKRTISRHGQNMRWTKVTILRARDEAEVHSALRARPLLTFAIRFGFTMVVYRLLCLHWCLKRFLECCSRPRPEEKKKTENVTSPPRRDGC